MNRRIALSIGVVALMIVILIIGIYSSLNYHLIINSNELNIILTFALVIFASVEAFSAIANYRIEKKRKRTVDLRNELEKLYGPIYSILNKVVYTKETNGILLPTEKAIIDEKISKYPFMVNQELYDYWKKDIRSLQETIGLDDMFTRLENSSPDRINEFGAVVYLVPKTFISKFLEEYDKKIHEYRKG
jgi:hypothetical protein